MSIKEMAAALAAELVEAAELDAGCFGLDISEGIYSTHLTEWIVKKAEQLHAQEVAIVRVVNAREHFDKANIFGLPTTVTRQYRLLSEAIDVLGDL